ncbi:hypothetical protein VTJ49DRAFT_7624 [Mycothermus thermophilus]|uniref:Uncharacterized protein n=1 Tax=Humicola insolens TaxID=85995 RepID=A0ABR3VHL5_HUMIN
MSEQASTTVVNGDSPHSNTLRHLLTIPAVQDGVRAFNNSPVGRVTTQLGTSAYKLVPAPLLSLMEKPIAYVTPYVTPYAQRVDEIGDQTLTRVVERYPVVKKPAPELLADAREAVYKPVRHVTEVYHSVYERESTNGNGGAATGEKAATGPAAKAHAAVVTGKAAVTTATIVSVEGAIMALREALRWGEGSRVAGTIKTIIDKLEKAALRQRGELSPTPSTTDGEQEKQEERDTTLKAAST